MKRERPCYSESKGEGQSRKEYVPVELYHPRLVHYKPSTFAVHCLTHVSMCVCVQELEAVRGGEAARLRELSAEQLELQNELEAVHTEHAQRLGEVRQEQRQLEHRLEQLRQQSCACQPKEQEAQYNAQVHAWTAAEPI